MSILSDNIRYLRAQKNLTQKKLADDLIITRARYSKYEEGIEPPLVILQRISRYFQVSIDLMLSVDLRKVPMGELLKLEGNRILLPITVDSKGENFIEVVPYKAKAGYLNGYADAEYIETLQHISLPFLGAGKYRAFPVEGDSMPPHKEGSFIVGRYIENWDEIAEGRTYVLLTRNEGIVYKRAGNKSGDRISLHSDNKFYSPFEIGAGDIIEVWSYACSIETGGFEPEELNSESVREMFLEIRKEISEIRRSGDKNK